MKPVLIQIAVLVGGCMALVSLIVNVSRKMELFTAVFRAAIVFGGAVFFVFLFLRLFALILTRFVAEQVIEQRKRAEQDKGGPPSSAASGSKAGGRG